MSMAEEQPNRYVANMSKAKRRGKIFVDYLRNQRGSTAIAPYSDPRAAGCTCCAAHDMAGRGAGGECTSCQCEGRCQDRAGWKSLAGLFQAEAEAAEIWWLMLRTAQKRPPFGGLACCIQKYYADCLRFRRCAIEAQRAKSRGEQRESARQRCLGDIHQLCRSREGKVRLDRVALGMENGERVVITEGEREVVEVHTRRLRRMHAAEVDDELVVDEDKHVVIAGERKISPP